jgi:NAD+-dependent protein deacetylase sirtuin 5
VKCYNHPHCPYFESNNKLDPIVPALATALEPEPSLTDKTGAEASAALASAMGTVDSASSAKPNEASSTIPISELPHCPECKENLIRPGVVWFGEALPEGMLETIDEWIDQQGKIDLMMVIGTTAEVQPAASYIRMARQKGARVAVVNMDSVNLGATGSLRKNDWMFEGDAGQILPKLFEGIIGKVETKVEE